MAEKVKIFKTIILFLFFLFGCSRKHVNAGKELFGEGSADCWGELDCEIVEQDGRGFSLNFRMKDMAVMRDSVRLEKFYERKFSEKGSDLFPFGLLVGLGGCLGGCYYGLHDNISWDGYDEERADRGCFISFASCIAGLSIAFWEFDDRRKAAKDISSFIKRDTLCVDKKILSKQKVKILVEGSDFEKAYYADENGNVELKYDEIIPEPAESDSVLNLIIQYGKMVDSVDVKIK